MNDEVAVLVLYSIWGLFMFTVGYLTAVWAARVTEADNLPLGHLYPRRPRATKKPQESDEPKSTTNADILEARRLRESSLSRVEKVDSLMNEYLTTGRVPSRPVEMEPADAV